MGFKVIIRYIFTIMRSKSQLWDTRRRLYFAVCPILNNIWCFFSPKQVAIHSHCTEKRSNEIINWKKIFVQFGFIFIFVLKPPTLHPRKHFLTAVNVTVRYWSFIRRSSVITTGTSRVFPLFPSFTAEGTLPGSWKCDCQNPVPYLLHERNLKHFTNSYATVVMNSMSSVNLTAVWASSHVNHLGGESSFVSRVWNISLWMKYKSMTWINHLVCWCNLRICLPLHDTEWYQQSISITLITFLCLHDPMNEKVNCILSDYVGWCGWNIK